MARASTTSDAFNAIAEAARREVLEALVDGEVAVNDLVDRLGMTQPQVSKHLAVLRVVDLVSVRADGRQRLYSLNADTLRSLYDWIKPFERLWNDRLDRLDRVIADLAEERRSTTTRKEQL